MKKASKGRLYKRGETYWIQYYVSGVRKQESLKTKDLEEAEKKKDKILDPLIKIKEIDQYEVLIYKHKRAKKDLKKLNKLNIIKLPISETWETYLRSAIRPDTGAATLKMYRGQWERFDRWCQSNKFIYFNDTDQSIAEDYYHDLKNSSYSAGTVNKHINLLKLVFKILGKQHTISNNPFSEIQKLKDKQNHRKEIPADILKVIIETAGDKIKNLIILGCETGLRLGDCCCLEWTEVNLTTGWIVIDPSKTLYHMDEPLHIKITPTLMPIFEATPKRKRKGYVNDQFAEDHKTNVTRITNRVQAHLQECGLEIYKTGTGPGTDKRAVIQYGFHSLRHSFVTKHQVNGVSQAVVQAMVGHKSRAMTQTYTHVGSEAIEEAMLGKTTSNGSKNTDAVIDLLEQATADNWEQINGACLMLLKLKK